MTNKMPPEKVPSKASENRRATKPIMEKRRRARINQCLTELKTLILDALNKDPSRHSKLEKADILEMTVRHLQNIQRQQMAAAISTDPSVLNKFRAGFSECASEVTRYVSRLEAVDVSLRQRLLSHLTHCVSTLNAASPFPGGPTPGPVAFPGMPPPPLISHLQALNVQIPGSTNGGAAYGGMAFLPEMQRANDVNNNNTSGNPSDSPSSDSDGKFLGGLPLIPGRLPNGDIAFLLSGRSPNGFGDPSDRSPGHVPWGPPTPTSPAPPNLSPAPSRRSSCCSPSSVGSALSPSGSEASEGHRRAPSPGRHPSVIVQAPPQRQQQEEPVWRPW